MLTTGESIKDWAVSVAGNAAIIIMLLRVIGAWGRKEYGEFIVNLAVGAIVFFLTYSNENAVNVLKSIGNLIGFG